MQVKTKRGTMAVPKIADVMLALDKRDMNYYTRLSDDQKKGINFWMMQRYASSVQGQPYDSHYLTMVNDCVNHNWSAAGSSRHPELVWKCLCLAGSGRKMWHPYVKAPTSKRKKNKIMEEFGKLFPNTKTDELELFIGLSTKEEIKDFLAGYGYDDKEIKEILK